jgi:integrase
LPRPANSEYECDCPRLRVELEDARNQIAKLTAIARDQAKALAELTDESPPWAPTLATVYWRYGPTRWAEPVWPKAWERLHPTVDALGDLPAIKLTPEVWGVHRAQRRLVPSRLGTPLKDSTLNLELGRAKEMLDWAVNSKLIKYNPLKSAKAVPTVQRRETRLPPDDLERLLAAADDVVDERLPEGDDDGYRALVLKAFTLCCFDSMLRTNEALNLQHNRIRDDGRTEVASRQSKNKRARVVFLTPRTLEAIAKVPRDPEAPQFVFARKGLRLNNKAVGDWFRRCAKKAGVDSLAAPGDDRVVPRDLRASGATAADEAGARATAVRDTLGHAHLATTEIYLRSEKEESARLVASAIIAATTRKGPRSSRMPARRVGK